MAKGLAILASYHRVSPLSDSIPTSDNAEDLSQCDPVC